MKWKGDLLMRFLKNIGFKNKKKYVKAHNYLENNEYDEALKLFNYLLDVNYNSFFVLFNLIKIHNDYNSLDLLLNKINVLLNDNNYDYYELLIHKGYIFYLKKEFDESINCFDEILLHEPNNLWANFYKAKVLYEVKGDCDYIKLCNMIKNNNEDYYLLLLAGEFFLELNVLDCALFCFDKSIMKHSKNPTAWRDKGMVLTLMEKYCEAIDSFNKSLKLKNDFIIWDWKGRTYYCMKDYENSLKCFDESLKINPYNLSALKNKMVLLFEINNLKESLNYCDKIFQICEDDIDVWNLKLEILQKLERYDELSLFYQKAKEKFDENPKLKKINKI